MAPEKTVAVLLNGGHKIKEIEVMKEGLKVDQVGKEQQKNRTTKEP